MTSSRLPHCVTTLSVYKHKLNTTAQTNKAYIKSIMLEIAKFMTCSGMGLLLHIFRITPESSSKPKRTSGQTCTCRALRDVKIKRLNKLSKRN